MMQRTKPLAFVSARHWEELPARGVTLRDLDREEFRRVSRLAAKTRWSGNYIADTPAPALEALYLRRSGEICQAAVVVFGGARAWQKYPQCALRTIQHGTDSGKEPVMDTIVRGPLLHLFDTARAFLDERLPASFSGERREILRGSVDEAVINALVHRDYSRRDGCVSISLYSDRVVIRNPGGLPEQVTARGLTRPHTSCPRNALIANAISRTELMYRWGRGISVAQDNCALLGLDPPAIKNAGDEVVVTFQLSSSTVRIFRPRRHFTPAESKTVCVR